MSASAAIAPEFVSVDTLLKQFQEQDRPYVSTGVSSLDKALR